MKMHIIIIVALVLFWCLPADAADINAASCSSSDVQSAINSASTGDRVIVPAGTCAWSVTVTIPSTVGITVLGSSGAATIIAGGFTLNSGSAGSRISGFTFTSNQAVVVNGSPSTAGFRIDHNIFTGGGTMLTTNGNGPGLIDHNNFTGGPSSEMIHNVGLGPGNGGGWTDGVTPGSCNMLYIEDNVFTFNASGNPAYFYGTSALQSYYGSRNVVRYNTCNMCQFDQHGTCGQIYARWWEFYENTFNEVPNANQYAFLALRGGSGVVYNNHVTGSPNGGAGLIQMQEDCSSGTYPILYQIGRGINQNYSPAYIWNNDPLMTPQSTNTTYVQQGRDFFVSSSQPSNMLRQELASDTSSTTYNYVPCVYPHPLQGAGPASPTGLTAVVH